MKNTRRCPKCHHDRILYIATVADRYGEHLNSDSSVPMKIAHYTRSAGNVLGFALATTARAGELEAGVCRRCGYTELYTKNPDEIVVDGVNVRELVADAPPAGAR
jgi:predicted nucleic-acid-binding Zn-ribbon protein